MSSWRKHPEKCAKHRLVVRILLAEDLHKHGRVRREIVVLRRGAVPFACTATRNREGLIARDPQGSNRVLGRQLCASRSPIGVTGWEIIAKCRANRVVSDDKNELAAQGAGRGGQGGEPLGNMSAWPSTFIARLLWRVCCCPERQCAKRGLDRQRVSRWHSAQEVGTSLQAPSDNDESGRARGNNTRVLTHHSI